MTATRLAMFDNLHFSSHHCQAQFSDSALAEDYQICLSFLDLGRCWSVRNQKSLIAGAARNRHLLFLSTLTIEQIAVRSGSSSVLLVPTTWLLFSAFCSLDKFECLGAKATFSPLQSAWARRLKCWKIIPISRRYVKPQHSRSPLSLIDDIAIFTKHSTKRRYLQEIDDPYKLISPAPEYPTIP